MSEKGTNILHTAMMFATILVGAVIEMTPQQESALVFLIVILIAAAALILLLIIVGLFNKFNQE